MQSHLQTGVGFEVWAELGKTDQLIKKNLSTDKSLFNRNIVDGFYMQFGCSLDGVKIWG